MTTEELHTALKSEIAAVSHQVQALHNYLETHYVRKDVAWGLGVGVVLLVVIAVLVGR